MEKINFDEFKILNLLPEGYTNPISLAEIHKLTGIDERTIREYISKLITVNKFMIGSTSNNKKAGYFWISNEFERSIAKIPLESRVNIGLKRLAVIKNCPIITKDQALTGMEHPDLIKHNQQINLFNLDEQEKVKL